MEKIMHIFPQRIKDALEACDKTDIEEIRMARGSPIMLITGQKERFLTGLSGEILCAGGDDIISILKIASEHSMYLKEDELNQGYLTIKGGYRIGVCGTVAYKNGHIVSHGEINSINIRVQKEIIGCGKKIAQVIGQGNPVKNTLIVSPPKKGKTTLLRDIARILSDENKLRVGIVDERKELWGTGNFNLGLRTDILCGCKKTDGIMMLIRAMSPQVIIVDELGGAEDLQAIKRARISGVSIIASVHGRTVEDVQAQVDTFETFIFLGDSYGEFMVCKGGNL